MGMRMMLRNRVGLLSSVTSKRLLEGMMRVDDGDLGKGLVGNKKGSNGQDGSCSDIGYRIKSIEPLLFKVLFSSFGVERGDEG